MGAALQEITGRVRQIGRGRTPPLRIGWRCGAKGVRIATSLRSSQWQGLVVRCAASGGVWAPRPTEAGQGVRCMSAGRRGNRRSAAGGGRSEPVSRKCPDWRPRQWAGIGWHDGGQSPPPTRDRKCGARGVRIATPVCGLVRNDIFGGQGNMRGAASRGRRHFVRRLGRFVFNLYTNSVFCLL